MNTYKIANKAKGIIRSYAPGPIGNRKATYSNEPFMRFNDVECTLTFINNGKDQNQGQRKVNSYNHDILSQIQVMNIPITEKLLSLLYIKNEEAPLFNTQDYYTSDDNGKIYLSVAGTDQNIYQVFIYNQNGVLENAYGEFDASMPLQVNHPNEQYSIYYSILGAKSYFLNQSNNVYISLDLIMRGNENDNTQLMCIHIEKAAIKINNNMRFNAGSNATDLTFTVIDTGLDYITVA